MLKSKKLSFEACSRLSHKEQVAYERDLAFDDLARSRISEKPIENPTVSGLFKSIKEVPALRTKQWQLIEYMSQMLGDDEILQIVTLEKEHGAETRRSTPAA
jgi:hypothetical protein